MNQSPIFLLGNHKSGTSLLRSLFDGHKDLYVVPFESHPFQILNYWINYPYCKMRPIDLDFDRFKSNILNWIHYQNKNNDRYADSILNNFINESLLNDYLVKMKKPISSQKDYFERYFKGIFASSNKGQEMPENLRLVEKSVENFEFAVDLQKMYPNAKFIHIVRNPYSNLVSFRKYKTINYKYPLIKPIVDSINSSYYFAFRYGKLIENYFLLKYEDLLLRTNEIMADLCDFLKIDFSDTLLTPTKFNGASPWSGNSIFNIQHKGISVDSLNNWEKEINDFEIAIVNNVFKDVLEKYGYQQVSFKKPYYPINGESIRVYLNNRHFLRNNDLNKSYYEKIFNQLY
jgi:hypothetical protein